MADKFRYAAFLVYPESAPAGWMDELKASHGMFAISPLHEPDKDESKPHYHVLYKHPGPGTLNAMRAAIPADVPANGYVEPVSNGRGYMRYLIHLDDPEKQQFSDGKNAITCMNAFPLDLSREYTAEDRNAQRAEVFALIRENGLTEYADLLDGLIDVGRDDLFDFAFNHTIALTHYLASRRHGTDFQRSQEPDSD